MLLPRFSNELGWTSHGLVTPATLRDAAYLAPRLRDEDRQELEDIGGRPAAASLQLGVLAGDPCVILRTTLGEPVAMLTITRTGPSSGAIALSGTPAIASVSSAFLRGSRECLAAIHDHYDLLYNVCDARNAVHRRWLGWLGFREIRSIPSFGAAGIPAVEFAKLRRT